MCENSLMYYLCVARFFFCTRWGDLQELSTTHRFARKPFSPLELKVTIKLPIENNQNTATYDASMLETNKHS